MILALFLKGKGRDRAYVVSETREGHYSKKAFHFLMMYRHLLCLVSYKSQNKVHTKSIQCPYKVHTESIEILLSNANPLIMILK